MSHLGVPLLVVALAAIDIVPTVGLRNGGEFEVGEAGTDSDLDSSATFGLHVAWPVDPERWLEVLWSRQPSEFHIDPIFTPDSHFDMDIDYLHFGGLYRPMRDRGARPFVGFSVGLTRFAPDTGGFGTETGFSLGANGGADFPLGARVGMRLFARGFLTFDEAVFQGLCGGTACTFRLAGDGMLQLEGGLGLVIRP